MLTNGQIWCVGVSGSFKNQNTGSVESILSLWQSGGRLKSERKRATSETSVFVAGQENTVKRASELAGLIAVTRSHGRNYSQVMRQ